MSKKATKKTAKKPPKRKAVKSKHIDETGSPQWQKLTQKQKVFVQSYFDNGFNATKAAITAGYAKASARSAGCQKLTNINIKAAIAAEMNTRGLSPDRLMKEIGRIAFADDAVAMEKWLDGSETLEDLIAEGELTSTAVQSIKITERATKEGVTTSKAISMYSKLTALEQLVRIQGLIIDHSVVKADVTSVVTNLSNEEAEFITQNRKGPE